MVMVIDQSFNNIVGRQSVPSEPVYSRKQYAVDIPHLKKLEDAVKTAPEEAKKIAIGELREVKEGMAAALSEDRFITIEEARAVIDALLANYGGGI